MRHVINSIRISAPRNVVFDISQDYYKRLDWDPFLKDIKILSKNKELQRGLKVWVKSQNRLEMTVEYLNFRKPEHVSMKMVSGPWMFKKFSGIWKFEIINNLEETTLVYFKYSFKLKLLLTPLNFLIKNQISKNMRHRLIALKNYIEY